MYVRNLNNPIPPVSTVFQCRSCQGYDSRILDGIPNFPLDDRKENEWKKLRRLSQEGDPPDAWIRRKGRDVPTWIRQSKEEGFDNPFHFEQSNKRYPGPP